jgi:hypothetical protein
MSTLLLTSAVAASVMAGASLAQARDCRPVETAPGVRVMPPGCRAAPDKRAATKAAPAAQRRERGVIDLGNGTEIRIHGRVRIEGGLAR